MGDWFGGCLGGITTMTGSPICHVSSDYKEADQLYRNNGDGTFREIAREVLPCALVLDGK